MNIGERVGDYEIVQILGAGGMGQVYKVRNVISNRVEAMKVLLPNLGGDQGLADRFLREIQVQASLDHPNIARLHTAQMAGDQLVMILEYVEGSTIEKLLEQGTLGVRESIDYIRQVLDALAYAHERGVVHRDIKPANIMRTPKGSIKLMDFGIARMQQDRRLTQTGSTVGSLFYMSPEQIRGSQPDPRSDLYSLGVTLYEMVTGRRPFDGTSDYSVMAAHLQQAPVAPIEVVPGVPQEVNDLILMAIAKDPEQRFQSAAAFRAALPASAGSLPPVAHTALIPSAPPPIPRASTPEPPPPMFAPAPVFTQQPAPTQPAFAPPPAFPPPAFPPPQASSRRGLYMTLGSIATVGVIALAIYAAPRFLHTGAATLPPAASESGTPPAQNTTTPDVGTPAQAEPAANSGNQVPSTPAQQTPATPPFAGQQTPAGAGQPAGQRPQTAGQQPGQQTGQQPGQQAGQRPTGQQQSGQQQAGQQQSTPPFQQPPAAVQQQAPPAGQQQQGAPPFAQQTPPPGTPPPGTPPQAQSAPPARQTPAATPELNDLRQDYNLVSVRAAAVKNGLQNFEQQQRRQGLNLRGDIVEAESRMDYLLKESMDSIRAGDAASGRRNLQMAERALETLEKFLGR